MVKLKNNYLQFFKKKIFWLIITFLIIKNKNKIIVVDKIF